MLGNLAAYAFQCRRRVQCVLLDILNKYFIVQRAENTFILHWKKVKTGIPDYPSLGEIETRKTPNGIMEGLFKKVNQKVNLGVRVDKYIMKKVRVVSLACDITTGPPLYPYQI